MMKNMLLLYVLFHYGTVTNAQISDSTKKANVVYDSLTIIESKKPLVSGAISVTNNGISLVPAFSLEKPAAIFDLVVKKNRFSFEPQFAFGFTELKPWYFVFWLHYKLIEKPKFNLDVAFHPGFLFSTINLLVDSVEKEYFTTSRFFVGAITPTYRVSKGFSIGAYYQHALGYNSDLKVSDFIGLNCYLSQVKLGSQLFISAVPQVYYLKNDDKDGFYANASISLAKRGLPFSLSTLLNAKLQSDIPSKDFLWNLTLKYSF